MIGGGLLWHTGVLHRISSMEHLIALLRGDGATGALLCIACSSCRSRLAGLARSPALLASVLIGAGASRGDYRSVIAIALLVLAAIGGYYWYQRRKPSGIGVGTARVNSRLGVCP